METLVKYMWVLTCRIIIAGAQINTVGGFGTGLLDVTHHTPAIPGFVGTYPLALHGNFGVQPNLANQIYGSFLSNPHHTGNNYQTENLHYPTFQHSLLQTGQEQTYHNNHGTYHNNQNTYHTHPGPAPQDTTHFSTNHEKSNEMTDTLLKSGVETITNSHKLSAPITSASVLSPKPKGTKNKGGHYHDMPPIEKGLAYVSIVQDNSGLNLANDENYMSTDDHLSASNKAGRKKPKDDISLSNYFTTPYPLAAHLDTESLSLHKQKLTPNFYDDYPSEEENFVESIDEEVDHEKPSPKKQKPPTKLPVSKSKKQRVKIKPLAIEDEEFTEHNRGIDEEPIRYEDDFRPSRPDPFYRDVANPRPCTTDLHGYRDTERPNQVYEFKNNWRPAPEYHDKHLSSHEQDDTSEHRDKPSHQGIQEYSHNSNDYHDDFNEVGGGNQPTLEQSQPLNHKPLSESTYQDLNPLSHDEDHDNAIHEESGEVVGHDDDRENLRLPFKPNPLVDDYHGNDNFRHLPENDEKGHQEETYRKPTSNDGRHLEDFQGDFRPTHEDDEKGHQKETYRKPTSNDGGHLEDFQGDVRPTHDDGEKPASLTRPTQEHERPQQFESPPQPFREPYRYFERPPQKGQHLERPSQGFNRPSQNVDSSRPNSNYDNPQGGFDSYRPKLPEENPHRPLDRPTSNQYGFPSGHRPYEHQRPQRPNSERPGNDGPQAQYSNNFQADSFDGHLKHAQRPNSILHDHENDEQPTSGPHYDVTFHDPPPSFKPNTPQNPSDFSPISSNQSQKDGPPSQFSNHDGPYGRPPPYRRQPFGFLRNFFRRPY